MTNRLEKSFINPSDNKTYQLLKCWQKPCYLRIALVVWPQKLRNFLGYFDRFTGGPWAL